MHKAFTLIELLVVIAIIAILVVIVILVLNPAELLKQGRDSNRVSDMTTLNNAIGLYVTDQSGAQNFYLGNASSVYVSIPDPTLSGGETSTCASIGLAPLPSGYTYRCSSPQNYRNIDGTGWIPVKLKDISAGAPLGSYPVDPTNNSSTGLFYTYTANGSQFEVTSPMESAKYGFGGSHDVVSTDGGRFSPLYEKGDNLSLLPGPPMYVQGSFPGTANGSNAINDSFSYNNIAGDTIIVAMSPESTSSSYSITDTAGNTYTLIETVAAGTFYGGTYLWYAQNIKGFSGTNTVSVVSSGAIYHGSLAIAEYSGIAQVNPIDGFAGANGSGATLDSGSFFSNEGDLIVGFAIGGPGAQPSPADGFVSRMSGGTYGGEALFEDKIASGTTADAQATIPYYYWVISGAAFKSF